MQHRLEQNSKGKPFEEMLKIDQCNHALKNIKQAAMIQNMRLAKNVTDRKKAEMKQLSQMMENSTSMAEASTSTEQIKMKTHNDSFLLSNSKHLYDMSQ